eukprot:TRINITY_DN15298_c0_g1_i1.p1 TRINITY_DN15298_c0_g1~~TRINITY_DN15298_c0_g1_i1.p1  ORF type:complete len:835 (+),score=164.52 TRINITY_DN15298_c0_g1_i1:79-2583(+)
MGENSKQKPRRRKEDAAATGDVPPGTAGDGEADRKPGKASARRSRCRQGGKRDTFPWINAQIISVSESGSLSLLASTVEVFVTQMNLVNISTAFHRLAKLWSQDADPQACLAARSVTQALMTQAKLVLERAADSGTLPSPQALANITWAMATLHCVDEQLLKAIVRPAQQQIRLFKPFELSTILWSYAKMHATHPSAISCSEPLFADAASHIPQIVQEFTFRCLVTTVWAYAAVRHIDEGLFLPLADQLLAMVHTANCNEIGNVAWAYGAAGINHEKLLVELARRAQSRLHEFRAQELSCLLWGFAANGFFNSACFHNAATAISRMELSPQQLTNFMWSFTQKKVRSHVVNAAVLGLLPAATRQVDRLTMPGIVVIGLAAAKVCKPSDATTKGGANATHALQLGAEFCSAAMQQVLNKLNLLSDHFLVCCAASFLALRAPGAVVMLAAAGREALDRLQILPVNVLLMLIRVFSVDLSLMQAPALLQGACQGMFRALFAESARRMDMMTVSELSTLSTLCAGPLGLNKSRDISTADLRSYCFALATTGGTVQNPLSSLDDFIQEPMEVYWDPDPVEPPKAAQQAAPAVSGFPFFRQGAAMPQLPTLPMSAWPPAPAVPSTAAAMATRPKPSQWKPGQPPMQGFMMPTMHPSMGNPGPIDVSQSLSFSSAHHSRPVPLSSSRTMTHDDYDDFEPRFEERLPHDTVQGQSGQPQDYTKLCSVKNTFLEFKEDEQDEDAEALPESALGPPLQFLPKDIKLDELQAYRTDYMKFRAGQATGARGEINDVTEVPLSSESTIAALGLAECSEGQIRRLADYPTQLDNGQPPVQSPWPMHMQ